MKILKKKEIRFYFLILTVSSLIFVIPTLLKGVNDSSTSLFFYAGIAIVLIFTRNIWMLLFYFLIIALNMYLLYVPCMYIGVTVTSVVYLFSISCMLLLLIKHRGFLRLKADLFSKYLFFVFTTVFIFAFNGYINETGVFSIIWRLSPIYMSLAIVILIKDYKNLQDVFIISIVIAAIIFTGVAFFELFQGSTFFYHLWTNEGERYRNGIMRVGSTLGDPNTLAMYIVPIIFLLWTDRCKNILSSRFCRVLSIMMICMIVLSSSRTSLLSLCLGIILFLWFSGKSKTQIYTLIIIFVTLIVSPFILPQIYNLDIASSGQRTMLVLLALKMWSNNMLFGIGLDNFMKLTYWMTMNEYVRQLVELGVFAFLEYIAFYGIFIKEYFTYCKKNVIVTKKRDASLIFAGMIAFAFNSISMESYFHYIMWILPPLCFIFFDEKL